MVGPESVSNSDEETALEAELRETSLLVASASQQAEVRRKQDQAVKRRRRCSLKLKHDQLEQSQRDRVVLANALRAQKKRTSCQAAEIAKLRRELDLFRHNQLHDLAGDYDDLLRTVRAHETAQDCFRQDLAQMQLAKQAAEFEAQTQAAAASAMREKLVESDSRVKTLEEKVARESEQRRALKERLLVLQERLCKQDNDSTVRLVTEAYERKIQDLESRHLKAQHKWFLESKRIIAKSEEDISARYKSIADAAIESARKTTAAKAHKQREEHRQLLEQMAQSRAESVPLHAHQNVVNSLEREISETRARLAAAEQGMHADALHARALDRDMYTAKQATDRTRVRMEKNLAARSNALELLQERLQDANSRLADEQRRVQQLETARARELAASKSDSARASEDRADLEATKRELEHMRGRHKIARETWEAKLEAMRVKVTRLEARLEAKTEDVSKSAAAHKTELDALKGELAVTLQTLNTVSAKHEALQSTVQVLVPEVKYARVAETSAQHRSLQIEKAAGQSMQEHRATENSLRAKLRTEQQARRRAENSVARHAAGLRALKTLCKKLKTAKERAERDLCEAQGTLQARLCSVESRLVRNSNSAGDHASSQQTKLEPAHIAKADLIIVEEQKS